MKQNKTTISATTVRATSVVLGAALVSVGVGMIFAPAGVITAGLLLLIPGVVGHLRGTNGG